MRQSWGNGSFLSSMNVDSWISYWKIPACRRFQPDILVDLRQFEHQKTSSTIPGFPHIRKPSCFGLCSSLVLARYLGKQQPTRSFSQSMDEDPAAIQCLTPTKKMWRCQPSGDFFKKNENSSEANLDHWLGFENLHFPQGFLQRFVWICDTLRIMGSQS